MPNIREISAEERARRHTAMLAQLGAARGYILVTYDTEGDGVHMNIYDVNPEELALASLRLAHAAIDNSEWSNGI